MSENLKEKLKNTNEDQLSDGDLSKVAGGEDKDDGSQPDPEFPVGTFLYRGDNGIIFLFRVSSANYDKNGQCYYYDIEKRPKTSAGYIPYASHVTADYIKSNFKLHEYECY